MIIEGEGMSVNISTGVGTLCFATPFFNASGPLCTTLLELEDLGRSEACAILSKSCTVEPREGNPLPRYADFEGGSINSMGLPNLGYRVYMEMYPYLWRYDKPIISSVSGLSLKDTLLIVREMCGVDELDAIEINLSCPNVVGKPQVAYDFDQTREVLQEVGRICTKPWGVKLPPYFDFVHFEEMAKILNESGVSFVTCINSLGNGLVIDAERECVVIKPKGGFGGVGGRMIKPIGLSNVRKFRELLRSDISIIGVGGIVSGRDVFEYILAGADAVQIGTQLQQEGVSVFARLGRELREVMERKGYSSLGEFKGKLKML